MTDRSRLGSADKARLLERLTARQPSAPPADRAPIAPAKQALGRAKVVEDLGMMKRAGAALGIANPFFRPHEGLAGATTRIDGRTFDNFVSYNYLGLNGHPRVDAAAKAAIDIYGTSVSASRVVSGERPIHRALEHSLAQLYGMDDAIVLVSGHATNVTVIAHLLDGDDLVIHDSLAHNSIVQGALGSGARRISFPHNDLGELDRLLGDARSTARRALIVVEGHYSMDGDIPDLARLIPIARRHGAHLMVDEAHSLGVLGPRGFGIAEHCGVDPAEVDIWMGTLSKTLSSCGGYVAASAALIDHLKCSAPGFVYSVGLSPPLAAAAAESLAIMLEEPERVARLQANGRAFLAIARELDLDTGPSIGSAIIPIMTGSSIVAARAADALFDAGINVQPIIYPAVPEQAARLRFFLSELHDPDRIERMLLKVAEVLKAVRAVPVDMAALASRIAEGG